MEEADHCAVFCSATNDSIFEESVLKLVFLTVSVWARSTRWRGCDNGVGFEKLSLIIEVFQQRQYHKEARQQTDVFLLAVFGTAVLNEVGAMMMFF